MTLFKNTYTAVLTLLVVCGAASSLKAMVWKNKLISAISKGNTTQVIDLLKGKNINATINGNTPLGFAVKHAKPGIVRVLLNKKADPNILDASCNAPLHEAVRTQNTKNVQLLVNAGANIHTTDAVSRTPLHYVDWLTKKNGHASIMWHKQIMLAWP